MSNLVVEISQQSWHYRLVDAVNEKIFKRKNWYVKDTCSYVRAVILCGLTLIGFLFLAFLWSASVTFTTITFTKLVILEGITFHQSFQNVLTYGGVYPIGYTIGIFTYAFSLMIAVVIAVLLAVVFVLVKVSDLWSSVSQKGSSEPSLFTLWYRKTCKKVVFK